MKRSSDRRGRAAAQRGPREIRVRMPSAAPAGGRHDVWVVNGRVIRFLDPSRPEDAGVDGRAHGVFGGLLRALRPRRRVRPRG